MAARKARPFHLSGYRLAGSEEVFENGALVNSETNLKGHGKPATPFAIGITLVLLLAGLTVHAQPVSPEEINQLDTAIGQRVEATAVLGTQSVASRAGLGWTLNNASGSIYKIPWETELMAPAPMASNRLWAPFLERMSAYDPNCDMGTFLRVAPVFQGGLGYGSFVNDFNDSQLKGNDSEFETFALSLGGGPRIYFGDSGFAILPAFGFIYAYTQNHFDAHNPAGEEVVDNGQYVNWHANTISLLPSFEARYMKTFGHWTPKFTSTFAYFNTRPITRSTDALSFRSSSEVWANNIDLDYLTNWKPLTFPMHFGGDIARTDLFGGLSGALDTGHYYQTDGRVTLDINGRYLMLKYVGLDVGYFWCSVFHGYSIGLEGSLQF